MNQSAIRAHEADDRDRNSIPGEYFATDARQLVELVRQFLRSRCMIRAQPSHQLAWLIRLRIETRFLPYQCRNDIEGLRLPAHQPSRPRVMPNQGSESRT